MSFDIVYLADRPDCVDACAAWAYGRWGVQKPDSSLAKVQEYFATCAQKDALPLTFLAINRETRLPIGMASLWPQDGTDWLDKTPWIAAVYTLYRYRGLGIARNLIDRILHEVKRFEIETIYLKSGSAVGMYRNFGFQELDRCPSSTAAEGYKTLLYKVV
ncbi:GNAT family N-acetyltransferase [Thalassospira sp.]|uniref:GNAT family N-acetyltransferase n=1 Tax=Thalassospira sp. TaxID=1912094 RepID=UPI002734F5B5|nr:GNAT family N-acetyltransferase [Thalassospira sp.]MDP2699305.1 GNAT family N-acetyltransferase [Thalassospira sp.]